MKLLALTTSFPQEADDFRGRFIAEWADSLSRLGHQVSVAAPSGSYAPTGVRRISYRSVGSLLSGHGAPEYLEKKPILGAIQGLGVAASMWATARSTVEQEDLLIGHWLVPSVCVALAVGRHHQRPIHGYVHGSDLALIERLPTARLILRAVDERAAGLTFVSRDLRDRFLDLLGRSPRSTISVIPMGISRPTPCSHFRASLMNRAAGRPIITTVGRMVPVKGLQVLAESLSGRRDLLWVAAGIGPEASEIRKEAARREVNVWMPGQISATEREALLASSALFVQPSILHQGQREGSPVSVIEAMAAGVPTVVTSTGGMSDIAVEAQCRLVEPGNPSQLSAMIDTLLTCRSTRLEMSQAHLEYAGSYLWENLAVHHDSALNASRDNLSCAWL